MDSPSHWQHNPVRANSPMDEKILCSRSSIVTISRTLPNFPVQIHRPLTSLRPPISSHILFLNKHFTQILTNFHTNIFIVQLQRQEKALEKDSPRNLSDVKTQNHLAFLDPLVPTVPTSGFFGISQ
ncbi:uncharacterized protein TrAtP1_000526 [Trichoderma atroviride]|uniref:uncharacterized protein n=1 Tax=Hypocrea atroviridis TaxID=63577 RepID=UPI00332C65DB|nr:hypothetical protein TrAtP1_000526 [Trichoderma atroviride]